MSSAEIGRTTELRAGQIRRCASSRERRGAALVVALAAMVVVMLSVSLLLGYISNMADEQNEREAMTQAGLSQTSSVEGLTVMLRRGEVDPSSGLPDFEIAGMITEFELLQTWQSGLFENTIELPDAVSLPGLAVTDDALLVAYIDNAGMIVFEAYDPSTFMLLQRTHIDPGDAEDWVLLAAEGAASASGLLGGILLDGPGEQGSVVIVSADGSTAFFAGDVPNWTSSSILQLAVLDNAAALIVSDGMNNGVMIPLSGWSILRLSSPAGTCPVVTADGSLLAGSGADAIGFGAPGVDGWVETDVNGDGQPDMVWFGSTSLAAYLQGSEQLYVDTPSGMRLVAWGTFDGSGGLAGNWMSSTGEFCWRRLGWNGFQLLPGNPVPGEGWSGRIYGMDGYFTGVAHGDVVLRDHSGSIDTVIAGGSTSLFADINGDGGIDVLEVEPGSIRILSNVVGASGMSIRVRATTSGRGVLLVEDHTISAVPETHFPEAGAILDGPLSGLDEGVGE